MISYWCILLLTVCLIHATLSHDLTLSWPLVVPVLHQLGTNETGLCGEHSRQLLAALDNATYWAVRIVDASGAMPSGILAGNTFNFGDFDSCVDHNPLAHYCLTSLRMRGPDMHLESRSLYISSPVPDSSVWEHMQRGGERWRALRDEVHVGLCLPASCTEQSIKTAALEALQARAASFGATFSSASVSCSDKSHLRETLSMGEVLFCISVGIVMVIVFGSTVADFAKVRSVTQSFSLRRHVMGLLSRDQDTGNQFLDMLRFLSILLIVMSHKMEYTMIGPLRNPEFNEKAKVWNVSETLETLTFRQLAQHQSIVYTAGNFFRLLVYTGNDESYTKLELMPMLNPSLVVDTFFFLGGLALSSKLLTAARRGVKIQLWSLYLQRYMRLTPPYMLVVFFYATILPRIGSGPLWTTLIKPESQYCKDNWWTNALYLNNYVKPEEMCLMHTWYLPCDMHLYLLCAPLVMLLIKHPRWGACALAVTGIASMLAPFLIIYLRDTDPFLLVFFDFLRSDRKYVYFTDIYVKTHLRATPYLGGILAGYLSARVAKSPLTTVRGVSLLVCGLLLFVLTAISGAPFYMDQEGWVATSRLARALYGAGHRATWAASLAMLMTAATSLHRSSSSNSSRAGKLTRATFPLASLCYCAYLLHITVIAYEGATVRDPVYTDELLLGNRAFGDTASAFLMALVLYLGVEAPCRDVTKQLMSKKPRQTSCTTSLELYTRSDDKIVL